MRRQYPTSPGCAAGARVDWPRMADGGYLGAGGRLAGGPADELVEAAYAHELRAAPRLAYDLSLSDIAHAVALDRERRTAGRDGARAARAACSSCTRSRSPSSPGRPRWATRSTRARPSSCAASARDAAGWLSAGRPAPRGVPRGAARLLAARRGRARERAGRRRRGARPRTPAGCATRSRPTTPTCRRPSRPPPGICCWPTPIRRCATSSACSAPTASSRAASPAPAAAPGRAGRSIARGSPSCSAARASSRTRRTRPGSGTSTPSCSRRSRSRPRTSRSSPRTSRSTPATSSG